MKELSMSLAIQPSSLKSNYSVPILNRVYKLSHFNTQTLLGLIQEIVLKENQLDDKLHGRRRSCEGECSGGAAKKLNRFPECTNEERLWLLNSQLMLQSGLGDDRSGVFWYLKKEEEVHSRLREILGAVQNRAVKRVRKVKLTQKPASVSLQIAAALMGASRTKVRKVTGVAAATSKPGSNSDLPPPLLDEEIDFKNLEMVE